MVDFKKTSELSNSELKVYMLTLENAFESVKAHIAELCTEMEKIENEYLRAKNEMEIRTKIY